MLSKESARETTIVTLQDKILQLEMRWLRAKDDLEEHISQHRRAVQAEAEIRDELASIKSEYEGFKMLIMSDIGNIQRELEKELKSAAVEKEEQISLRTEMSLWSSRIAFAEKKLEGVQCDNKKLVAENRRLLAKVSMEDDRVKLLQGDCEKWRRIALVAAAAKNREAELLDEERRITKELQQLISSSKEEQGHITAVNHKVIMELKQELTTQIELNSRLSKQVEVQSKHIDHLTDSLNEITLREHTLEMKLHRSADNKVYPPQQNVVNKLTVYSGLEPEGYRKVILFHDS